jgi:glycosyltransferase involved in cell wall biosynthesis
MPRLATGTARSADVELALAKIWKEKGKLERALLGYQQVLQLSPAHLQATIEIPAILLHLQRVPEALAAARQALQSFPNEAQLHKSFVQALVAHTGSLAAAFEHYQLTKSDDKAVVVKNDDVLCCCAVRNESVRLPYFLSFYRQRGVRKFFFVDNDSTDGTLSYLLQQPDVHVWRSSYSFNSSNFGSAWFELLLRSYGTGHWCLIVDADELLYYPESENKSLVTLSRELEAKKKHAFSALLLEMYSDKAIKDTQYASGQRLEDVCPYFDRQFYHTKSDDAGPYRNQTFYFGGVRQRVFGAAGDFLLSKVPLLRYDSEVVLAGGQHWTSFPKAEIAEESGCLLHFKFLAGFGDYVAQEVTRKEHAVEAYQYKEYAKELTRNEATRLYDEQHSVRFRDSQQLVQLGIMQKNRSRGDYSITAREIEFPMVRPRRSDEERPFWSVMITAYNRAGYLEKALRSVLEQAPDSQAMQIEVIHDGGAPESVREQLAAIVHAVGGDRVTFHAHPNNLGHPHVFNLCLERARGHWIHILHDDDWVQPGFYAAIERGIRQAPDVGAAFCRHAYVDQSGTVREFSRLEQKTPGIVPDWLQRIAEACRLQTPAIVVNRKAYEQLGGFCPQAASAFDWEMWKRIAVHYAVWYEPEPLACFRQHLAAESSNNMRTGQQIADTRRAIEISRTYLPKALSERLSQSARNYYALYALQLAEKQLAAGDYTSALTNIHEGLICSQWGVTVRALMSLLSKVRESNSFKQSDG